MANIKKLVHGQIVYSVEKTTMGNTRIKIGSLYEVKIIEVHEDYVVASWNRNTPRKFSIKSIAKWKVNRPKVKRTVFGVPSY